MGAFDGIREELAEEERKKQTAAEKERAELRARCRQVAPLLKDYAKAAGELSRRMVKIPLLLGVGLFGGPKTREIWAYRMLVGEGYFYKDLEGRLYDGDVCSVAHVLQKYGAYVCKYLYIDPRGRCYLEVILSLRDSSPHVTAQLVLMIG